MSLILPEEERIESTWARRKLLRAHQLPHDFQNGLMIGRNNLFDGVPEVAAVQTGANLETRRRRQVEMRGNLD